MIAMALLTAVLTFSIGMVVYPYFIYPRLLNVVPRRPSASDSGRVGPESFALLFCAFNEAKIADQKIANLEDLVRANPGLQVLIYDDGSTDGCDQLFSSRSDLATVIRGPGRRGKAHGMKHLVSQTEREFIIFTDANVLVSPEAIQALGKHFSDPEVGGVCGHLTYISRENSGTELAGGTYWALDERLKYLESRSGNVMGGDGSIFAVRRALYPDFPDTVQDDFTVTMSVVFSGSRLIYARDVEACENLVSKGKDEYRRKVRIAARAFHTHLAMAESIRGMSRLDRWKYYSHKYTRWFGGVFVLLGGGAALLILALLEPVAAAGVPVIGLILLVAGSRVSAKVSAISAILLALAATTHGVYLATRGRTYATWTPPESR